MASDRDEDRGDDACMCRGRHCSEVFYVALSRPKVQQDIKVRSEFRVQPRVQWDRDGTS